MATTAAGVVAEERDQVVGGAFGGTLRTWPTCSGVDSVAPLACRRLSTGTSTFFGDGVPAVARDHRVGGQQAAAVVVAASVVVGAAVVVVLSLGTVVAALDGDVTPLSVPPVERSSDELGRSTTKSTISRTTGPPRRSRRGCAGAGDAALRVARSGQQVAEAGGRLGERGLQGLVEVVAHLETGAQLGGGLVEQRRRRALLQPQRPVDLGHVEPERVAQRHRAHVAVTEGPSRG